ncbi:MAG: hypothetical protein ACI4DS_07150, partial [Eubacterium sp.]
TGGGLYIATNACGKNGATIIFDNNKIYENSASDGGGVYTCSPIKIVSGYINYNSVSGNGGAIYTKKTSLYIAGNQKTYLNYNESGKYGGAVFVSDGSEMIMNNASSYVSYNKTTGTSNSGGAGIAISSQRSDVAGMLKLYTGSISGNISSLNGGGILNNGDTVIYGGDISLNIAGNTENGNGGGICNYAEGTLNFNYKDGYKTLIYKNYVINENGTTQRLGGGICNHASTSIINFNSKEVYIYHNGYGTANKGFGIHNVGIVNVKAGIKVGFSSFESIYSYTEDDDYSGAICNIGTVNVINTLGTQSWDKAESECMALISNDGYALYNTGSFYINKNATTAILSVKSSQIIRNLGNIRVLDSINGYDSIVCSGGSEYGIVNADKSTLWWGGIINGNIVVTENGVKNNDNVSDCNIANGIYNYSNSLMDNDSTVCISGGDIYNCGNGIFNNIADGVVVMNSGNISYCEVHGVNNRLGKFYFNGGSISHNNSSVQGAGIYNGVYNSQELSEDSFVSIRGGKISYNTTSDSGGALSVKPGSTVEMTDGIISNNTSVQGNGGGIIIDKNGRFTLSGGSIEGNISVNGYGNGIYNGGIFNIYGKAQVGDGTKESNNVYLKNGCPIHIISDMNLTKDDGYIAILVPQQFYNGNIVVSADFEGSNGETELYYEGTAEDERKENNVIKKFLLAESDKFILRPTLYVNDYKDKYIIISEKYTIEYDSNMEDDSNIRNMPSSENKFWEENIYFSNQIPEHSNYTFNDDVSWNTQNDGAGVIYPPGSVNIINSDLHIYAIWGSLANNQLSIEAVDRFYIVNQNITINKTEVLKKVKVLASMPEDNYKLGIIGISKVNGDAENFLYNEIENLQFLKEEYYGEYISLSEPTTYQVTLYAVSQSGIFDMATMKIYVLDAAHNTPKIRFIRKDYLWTLTDNSKWKIKRELSDEITTSFDKDSNESIATWELSSNDIKSIKEYVAENNYNISEQINQDFLEKYNYLRK